MALNYTVNGGGVPPETVEYRSCPKDPFHWRTEGNQCPVCKSKIKVTVYSRLGER